MSLIVETGAVVTGAEAYCTVAYADDYHSKRGNAAWAVLDDVDAKEPALRRATDYMVQMYRARWKGFRKSALQVLDWPRTFVYLEPFVTGGFGAYPFLVADTIVPDEVMRVCAEFALRAATADLSPDLARGVLSETVGPLAVTYDPNSPESARYRALDALLAPYLSGSSMNAKLVRA